MTGATPSKVCSSWIGPVPSGWAVVPLKRLAPFVSRGDSPEYSDDGGIPVVNQACIQWSGLKWEHLKYQKTADIGGWKGRLRKGDVLLNSTGTGTLGRCVVFDRESEMMADGHVTIIRTDPSRLRPMYLRFLLETDLYQGFIYSALTSGSTNQIELSREGLRATPIVLPPRPIQDSIVRFLEDRCAQIDEIITKKQRLIELLAEQKSALITHAVTRGLDPSVPMKDSGIPWLGQVPTHWRFTKFGYLVRMVSGSTPDKGNANYWQGSVPWVSPKDMKTPVILDSEDHISEPAVRECGMHLLPVNSVLIVVRGMILAHSFPVAVTGVPVTINQDMKGLLPKPNCDAAFLAHYLRGTTDLMLSLIEDSAHGTKCLRTDRWKSVGLYLPDIPEQSAISRWIDEQNSRFVKVAGDLNAQIEKLLEYRSALITAAVTGQIDVNHRRLNSI